MPRINGLDPAAFADTASYRMWQVAGGPHTPVPTTQNVRALVVRDLTPGSDAAFPRCAYPLGITPTIPFGVIRIEYVLRAAVAQLQRWVRTGTAAAHAHHSIANAYDSKRQETVEGTVSEFRFVNPHPVLIIAVAADGAEPDLWELEMDNRNELAAIGIKADTWRPGQRVVARFADFGGVELGIA